MAAMRPSRMRRSRGRVDAALAGSMRWPLRMRRSLMRLTPERADEQGAADRRGRA